MIHTVFEALDKDGQGFLSKEQVYLSLSALGLRKDDPRFKETFKLLKTESFPRKIRKEDFERLLATNKTFLLDAFCGKIIIPDFSDFSKKSKLLSRVNSTPYISPIT